MKNFKKLFIALPLVLVMLFAALPVFALEANTYKLQAGNLKVNLAIDEDNTRYFLSADTYQMPIWAAEKTTYADSQNEMNSAGAGWISMLNKGLPVGWVEANPDAAAPLTIGQYAVENLAFFKDNGYFLPTYNINHVEIVDTNIKVPASWTKGYKAAAAYYVKGNQVELVKAGASVDALPEGAKVADGFVTYGTQKVAVTATNTVDPSELVTATLSVGAVAHDGKYRVNLDKGTEAGDNNKIKKGEQYTLAELEAEGFKQVAVDTVNETGTYTYQPVKVSYTLAAPLYQYVDGEAMTGVTQYITKGGKTYVNDGKNDVEVTVGKVAETFVDATLRGLLVIVEEKYVPVTVKHHYMVADGEEIVKETKENQDKNVVLTANNILQSWLMPVGGYVYDPAKTKVEAVKVDKTLVNGEVFVTGYVVDLFYTAAQGENSDIEAAFANTTAGVANQSNVANLPATGAASNVAVILSSVALVVVGLFLKK